MSNTLFAKARESFGTQVLNWLTQDFRIAALKTGYSVDEDSADYLSDLDDTQIVATSDLVTGKSMARGWFYALPTRFAALTSPNSVGSLAVYRDTGVAATSDLVLYIRSARSMPFTFTGGAVYVLWQIGDRGIFRL